jgi:signal transduction histidine kinase
LISLGGGWVVTGRALAPVTAVSRVARQIAATGRFEQRIDEPAARDELRALVATFNEMLGRLAEIFERQRVFVADASHDLRSPLTVIRGNLDLLRLDLPEADRRESVRAATSEVERMGRLVSDLLFLAEADATEMVGFEPVALDEVVLLAWQRALALDEGKHELILRPLEAAAVRGDAERLTQMVWNLLENALRYTPAGGMISLGLRDRSAGIELVLSDSGIGIPAEHLPRIFERFYRVDRARSRSQKGTGLGLAIVKQVVDAHGAEIRVQSVPGQGTTFTVLFPAGRCPGGKGQLPG